MLLPGSVDYHISVMIMLDPILLVNLVQGRRHDFSPVGAIFPIYEYIIYYVLAEFQRG